jgi:DNA polymerase III subunit beta
MRFTAKTSDLSAALKLAMSCAERKSTLPIMSHVLTAARDGEVVITAGDLDREVSIRLAASVQEDGSAAVDGGMFMDIATSARQDGEIAVNPADGSRVQVTSGRSRFQVPCLPAGDFPLLPATGIPVEFEVDAAPFRKALADVVFAVDTIEARAQLCGVHMHAVDGMWRAVATDGKRLALYPFQGPAGLPGAILPPKTIGLIGKLFAEDKTISLSCHTALWVLKGSRTAFKTKLIDGRYVDYDRPQIIPRDQKYRIGITREEMIRAVDRANIANAGKDSTSAIVAMSFGENVMRIRAASSVAESFDEIEADCPSVPFETGVCTRYLQDALKMMEGENITLTIDAPTQPMVFRDGRKSVLCVVVPIDMK